MKKSDAYFVSCLFAYGAELKGVEEDGGQKTFEFNNTMLDIYMLCNGVVSGTSATLEDIYKAYQTRTLLYPPNFPDGRRRFLELLHADQ